MADLLYRLVANFQYRENYAAHDWDGKGECPQGWKFKGGESVTFLVGVKEKSNHYIQLVEEKMAEELAKYIWSNNYSEQYLIGWDWEVASSWTEQEEIDAYCDWHEDLFGTEEDEPFEDRFFDVAAVCGFEEYA